MVFDAITMIFICLKVFVLDLIEYRESESAIGLKFFCVFCAMAIWSFWKKTSKNKKYFSFPVSFKVIVTVAEMGNNWNILNQLTVTEIKTVTEM